MAGSRNPPSMRHRHRLTSEWKQLQKRGMDKSDLTLAATTTFGRFYTMEDVDRLASEIPRGTPIPLETDEPIPLWNRWEFLGITTLLLTVEWLIRKRCKLL